MTITGFKLEIILPEILVMAIYKLSNGKHFNGHQHADQFSRCCSNQRLYPIHIKVLVHILVIELLICQYVYFLHVFLRLIIVIKKIKHAI